VHGYGVELRLDDDSITTIYRRYAFVIDETGNRRKRGCYDIGLAYANTCHKQQGATIPYGILVFESWAPNAWGYTALSRFQNRGNLKVLGNLSSAHFKPRAAFSELG